MSKSSRGGFRRSNTTVSVIETKVHRSAARNARIAFVISTLSAGVLSMTITSAYVPPIASVLIGVFGGIVLGALVYAAVRIWPVARIIWWWAPELGLAVFLVWLWAVLAGHTPMPVRAVVMVVVLGVLLFPVVRRNLVAIGWCLAVRHRLRSCFAQFIIANRSGSLPLILFARPTPVGERVWIYLRTGLSPTDLEARADKIAVACHASSVIVERASSKTSALVRLDLKRREVLVATVGNPLAGMVAPVSGIPAGVPASAQPDGLDLADIPEATRPAGKPAKPIPALSESKTATVTPISVKKVAAVVSGDDDLSDWID